MSETSWNTRLGWRVALLVWLEEGVVVVVVMMAEEVVLFALGNRSYARPSVSCWCRSIPPKRCCLWKTPIPGYLDFHQNFLSRRVPLTIRKRRERERLMGNSCFNCAPRNLGWMEILVRDKGLQNPRVCRTARLWHTKLARRSWRTWS